MNSMSMSGTWTQFLDTGEVPDFPEKGRYRVWDKSWNPIGYTDEPSHAGQQPTRYPEEWTPAQCHVASQSMREGA